MQINIHGIVLVTTYEMFVTQIKYEQTKRVVIDVNHDIREAHVMKLEMHLVIIA
jgi:hypothetical protein